MIAARGNDAPQGDHEPEAGALGGLAHSSMRMAQILVVAVMVWLGGLDGFDVVSISFAAPDLARDWHLNQATLGVVLSVELFGMAIGSIALGTFADQIGRRPILLGGLVAVVISMTLTMIAGSVAALCASRIVTGLGIGGLQAATPTMATEFANDRRRDLCVVLVAMGYPAGVIAGGSVAELFLKHADWRGIFGFGAGLAAVSIPLVALLVPESPRWLAVRRPADALSKLNRVLARLGMSAMTTLPPQDPRPIAGVWLALFAEGQRRVTALITSAFLLHITTFYFTLKWIPKIVSDLGLSSATAASVLIWSNVGSLSGGLLVGLLTPRLGLKNLTCGLLLGTALSVAVLGWVPGELTRLIAVCFLIGFCTDGGVVGLFALLARVFPTALRAAGTGFAIGTGRAGAGLGPLFAGLLFEAQSPRPLVTAIMAGGSLLAACALLPLPLRATTEGVPRR